MGSQACGRTCQGNLILGEEMDAPTHLLEEAKSTRCPLLFFSHFSLHQCFQRDHIPWRFSIYHFSLYKMTAKLKSAKNGYFASWPRVIFSVIFSPFLLHQCIYRDHTMSHSLWHFLPFMTFYKVKAFKKWLWTSNSVKNRLFLELFSCHFFCSFFFLFCRDHMSRSFSSYIFLLLLQNFCSK